MKFKIDAHEIGERNPPFIIAELSANHNGSIELAKRNIDAAKKMWSKCNQAANI